MNKVLGKVRKEWEDTVLLLRSVPSMLMVFFCVSVILMNLLANKELSTGIEWLALDCGITVSWLSFLSMDMLAKRFGPKAAIKLSLIAMSVNLFVCGMLKIVSIAPGNWGEFYTFGEESINLALNNTFGGTWYVLFGSTVAFVVSSIVNAILNYGIGKMIKKKDFKEFAARSYISTMVAQFVDNLVFALIVSVTFFGWNMVQVITCSLTGCLVELLCEVIFSPIGYKICKRWENENVGAAYIEGKGTKW
jgi:uncharacterized PurR-regulated membrane protein YhhQ (DUF165 family)